MALVKTDNTIIAISGRLGGVYFKTGKDGIHVQSMPRAVNYARIGMQGMRVDRFSEMAWLWMLALLGAMAGLWFVFGMVNVFTDKKGQQKKINGYLWYMYYSMMFAEAEQLPFWKPPHAVGDEPDFYCNYKGKWIYEHTPAEWPVNIPIDYFWEGTFYNEHKTYNTDDLVWFMWYGPHGWTISTGVGYEELGMVFYSVDNTIFGYYLNPVTKEKVKIYIGNKDTYHEYGPYPWEIPD